MSETTKSWLKDFRAWLTLLLLLLLIYWTWQQVAPQIGVPATKDDKSGLLTDPYSRSKEILLIIGGYVATALGFWFGAKGTDVAQQQAQAATAKADQATSQASALRQALPADKLNEVIEKNRDLFGAH